MTFVDELARLAELHQRGALSEQEYELAKQRLLNPQGQSNRASASTSTDGTQTAPLLSSINKMQRPRQDRWIAGVCGGLAQATGLASWAWRLGFVVISLFGGAGVLAYVLLWLFVPQE